MDIVIIIHKIIDIINSLFIKWQLYYNTGECVY
jgi:hypothetical protein